MIDQFADQNHMFHDGDISQHTINGELISTGVTNAFSQDYFLSDGAHEHAVPNAEGGMDVYKDGALHERIIPDGHGSHHVYDSQMQLKATINPNMLHGHDVLHDATLLESSIPGIHGASTVLNYSDPLAHLSEYSMTKLVLG